MKYTLTNCIILDGTLNMKPIIGSSVEIIDGYITRIGDFKPTGEVIDLNGAYIAPGMINLHAHLPSSGKVNKKKKISDQSKLVKFICSTALTRYIGVLLGRSSANLALNSGVTTIRTVGGVSNFDSRLRNKINSGKWMGPRLLVSDSAIGVKGGHMDGTVATPVENKEDIEKIITEHSKNHVDLIKLMITGGVLDSTEVGHPGKLRMSPELVKIACDLAHEKGYKVAAHVESPEGIKVAILNGVDSIEHGSSVDDETLNLLKERNGALVATFSPTIGFSYLDPSENPYGEIAKINTDTLVAQMTETAKKCLDASIPVGLGTDAGSPYVTHYDFYRELIYFVKKVGVSNNFALHTATLVNAKIAGVDNITGSIEKGKAADIIVLSGNPLDDLHYLKNPKMVIYNGNIINKPLIKRNLEIESILNKLESVVK